MIRNATPKALTFTCLTYLSLTYSTISVAEQVLVPLEKPCRLIDTRTPGTPFTHEERQDFLAWSDGNPLTAQGGDNCELPPGTGTKPSAIAANITAVSKPFHAKGNLLAYPFTDSNTSSDASLINFSDNNIANASIISLSPDANKHFSITGNIFNTTGAANSELKTHVVVDVTGYFYEQADTGIHLKNVVTVSQQGDGFTDPIAAMDEIKDASDTNPYLLEIGPGNFNLSQALQMKEYVTIKGAGTGLTILQGNTSAFDDDPGSSVMIGANHATVTHLTLVNIQGDASTGSHRRGIINKDVSPTIENIKIEITGTGAQHCVGILNEREGGNPLITHVDIDVNCDNTAYGIFNFLDATPVISYTNVRASGNVLEFADGIHNSSGVNATIIRHSIVKGDKAGIRTRKGAQARVSFTQISGGITDNDNDGSANTCGHSVNSDTSALLDLQCDVTL